MMCKCRNMTKHLVTDIDGKNYYRCSRCEIVYNQQGEVFNGYIAFISGGKTKTLSVQGGYIK